MSPYVYRCHRCGIASAPVDSLRDAAHLRAAHRAAVHEEAPDVIEEIPRPSSGWRSAALLLALMAIGAVTLTAGWIRRHF